MNRIILIITTAFLCFSCTSDKPSAQGVTGAAAQTGAGAAYALEIMPKNATRESTLQLIPRGFDLSDAKIEWLVNDRPFTTLVPTEFAGAEAEKGEVIQARATVREQEILSDSVLIMNTPPEIVSSKFIPDVVKKGDALGIEAVGNDADGDSITILYEWTLNGSPAGKGQSIEGALKRGDKITVQVTPFDGEAYGRSVSLSREIANWPPVFLEHKEFSYDGSLYTYQAKASDPDGDPLTFSLASAQAGMAIDPSSGVLTWTVPSDFKGKTSVTLIVSDGHGGTGRYTVEASIR
jgi:hypothetical protein